MAWLMLSFHWAEKPRGKQGQRDKAVQRKAPCPQEASQAPTQDLQGQIKIHKDSDYVARPLQFTFKGSRGREASLGLASPLLAESQISAHGKGLPPSHHP